MKNKYRLLREGEIIKPADERLDDNCEDWCSLRAFQEINDGVVFCLGRKYDPTVLVPMRRLIDES